MPEPFVTLAAYHMPVEAELRAAGWRRRAFTLFSPAAAASACSEASRGLAE